MCTNVCTCMYVVSFDTQCEEMEISLQQRLPVVIVDLATSRTKPLSGLLLRGLRPFNRPKTTKYSHESTTLRNQNRACDNDKRKTSWCGMGIIYAVWAIECHPRISCHQVSRCCRSCNSYRPLFSPFYRFCHLSFLLSGVAN